MTRLETLEKMKYCPLCLRKFTLLEESGKTGKVYFFCNFCKVIIWIRDVLIGHYDEFEPVPCPTCGEKRMRFFCREDLYCKWKCPKCGTEIENKEPDLAPRIEQLKKERDGKDVLE